MSFILDSLRAPPPEITASEVAEIALQHYDLSGKIQYLGGERDRNFLINSAIGEVTLKVANPVESDSILEMQCDALRHLEQHSPTVPVPRVINTTTHSDWVTFTSEADESLRARVFSFLPGDPIEQGATDSSLLFNLGKTVAEMDIGLRGYMHPAGQHSLAWNIQILDQLSDLVHNIEDVDEKVLIEKTLAGFVDHVKPQLPTCRSQIIHNDVCFHNTAVSRDDPTEISGVFDFGDMVYGPLIQDLANPAAEVPAGSNDPLSGSAKIIAGFHSCLPLEDREFGLLPHMIAARLALCLLLETWAETATGWTDDRDHLDGWRDKSVAMLKAIVDAPEHGFENLIRSTCGVSSIPEEVGANLTSDSDAWNARQHYLGNANYYAYDKPVHIVKAEGVWIHGADGKRYLDMYNNVPHAGHCHPRITAAINKQTALLNTNTRYVYDIATQYAERITSTLPDGLDCCYFVSSGSEANDLAWRLSTAWTGNHGGLVLDNAYHGVTECTYALSPAESRHSDLVFPHIGVFAAPDDFRGQWRRGNPERGKLYAQGVQRVINELAKRGYQPAAMYLDMIMSSNGVFTPPPGYLETLFDIVRNAGGLCIADEVQSGFGRTGKHMWGFQFGNVTPDIVTFGKPIAGGYPMGLVVTRKEIAQKFEDYGDFFSTTGGNPVACAAGLAMLDVIKGEQLMANADRIGREIREGLTDIARHHTLIGDVRGSGLFIGVELVNDRETRQPATIQANSLINSLRDNGILIGSDGIYNNVLKIRPPMVIDSNHVKLFLDAMEQSLQHIT